MRAKLITQAVKLKIGLDKGRTKPEKVKALSAILDSLTAGELQEYLKRIKEDY